MNFVISEPIAWIIIAVVFAVIEAFTLGLTTIWFTVGGVAACIVALLGGSLVLQIIIFLVVSIVLLYFTRPLAVRKLKIGHEKNIVENIIGQIGIVKDDILPFNVGQVKLNGQIWSAVSNNNDLTLLKGLKVKVVEIQGVKLIVEPVSEND
ncbi:NfeD family protein [Anaerovorax odorimutans]|uniref:NfeD family protein n=1 Tax=Anaerovorax odorimutans TaxID=109327 RepID=UPI0004216BBF|nr:NfeD family protein [Anaerovorax odorimutans]